MDDYFAAVTAHDAETLASLFTPDATLHSGDVTLAGRDNVVGYYTANTFTFDDFLPEPGPLQIDGSNVSVTIRARMGGKYHTVHDVFETENGRIKALHITGFDYAIRSARQAH
jgi:hypothetical protein